MASFTWTFAFAAATTIFLFLFALPSEVRSESTAFPVIPSQLLECYMNDGIYHRANRMPSTLRFFLDLLRKVEESPTARNMNARELSVVLLHYLKLDGIQSLQSQTKFLGNNILPFAPSGDEYFKHRLTLIGLVPRIDPRYIEAINESLTQTEMCNLHFMLSYSIDPYKREDEKCSHVNDDGHRGPSYPDVRPEWDPYLNRNGFYRRHRRSIQNINSANHVRYEEMSVKKRQTQELNVKKSEVNKESISKSEIVNEEVNSKESHELLQRTKRRPQTTNDKKSEVEAIIPNQPKSNGVNEKDKFTIGDQELLSAGEQYPKVGMQSLIQTHNFGRYGGRDYSKNGNSGDENMYSGVIPGIPLSDCPVVNGVITSPFGSLTIGTVIAGIAAGLNPEDIHPSKLSVSPSELETPTDRLKNTWGVTLAGTVADSLSSSALLDIHNLKILEGAWNDTLDPKWYLIKTNQFRQLNEVSIRGSLDGLLLALNAKEWTNKFSNFKLSQMLETYYIRNWDEIGARYRSQLRPKYAPDDIFVKQVHLMSLVLRKQKTNVLTVLDYSHIAREAVDKVIQHIQKMDSNERSSIGAIQATENDILLNTIAVVDSSWGHETLLKIFTLLRENDVVGAPQTNLTILCGYDGRILLNSSNGADLYHQFSKEMLQENCNRGMNLPAVFDSADFMYRNMYFDEKTLNKMNKKAQVLVLFPFDSLLSESSVVERSIIFRKDFPDVRVVVAPKGPAEIFTPLVKRPSDIFPIIPFEPYGTTNSVKSLAEGLKNGHQRITRPSCGSYFDDQSEGQEVKLTTDVYPGGITYYRLLPNYFYTVTGQAVISIRSKRQVPLTICHSREMERPMGPTPRESYPRYNHIRNPNRDYPPQMNSLGRQMVEDGPVECKTITSETYRIELNNPCEGSGSLAECRPLYVSVTSTPKNVFSCSTCRMPMNVEYEISAVGLTCYNSAVSLLLSPLLFSLVIVLLFTNNKIF